MRHDDHLTDDDIAAHDPDEITDEADDVFLPAPKVERRYGISSMTLYRWCRDPRLDFPQPMIINRCRYWRLRQLRAFERRQARRAA